MNERPPDKENDGGLVPTKPTANYHLSAREVASTMVTRQRACVNPVRPRRANVQAAQREFRRALVQQAMSAQLLPWSSWLRDADRELRPGHPATEPLVKIWSAVRADALRSLAELDLTASVNTTASLGEPTPLSDHLADEAGLVRVHSSKGDWSPSLPATTVQGTDAPSRHAVAMAAAHGLFPAELPTDLRGFLGQASDCDPLRPAWLDRVRSWVDADSIPVLTAEPFADFPGADPLADALATIDARGLPLTVEIGVSVWAPGSRVLLIVRPDPDAPVAPAEWAAPMPAWAAV